MSLPDIQQYKPVRGEERAEEALRTLQRIELAVDWLGTKQFFERQWAINMAFYAGHQDITWDNFGQRPVAKVFPEHRSRYTANKILPAVELMVSMLGSMRPNWDAAPQTSSTEDTQAARVANKLLDHYWDALDMEQRQMELLWWAAITGTAFYYITTNKNPRTKQRLYLDPIASRQGKKRYVPSSRLNDSMRRMFEAGGFYEDVEMYEPKVVTLSPFRLAFDPRAPTIEDARFVYHIVPTTVDEVWEQFGIVVDSDEPPPGMTDYESRFRSFWGAYRGGGAAERATDYDQRTVYLRQVVTKPYVERDQVSGKWKEYPNGRHIIYAGGKILVDDENPYHVSGFPNSMPFFCMKWHHHPGRIWGMGMVELAIDPQKAHNDIRRRSIDMFRLMGQPKWVAPKGHGLKRRAITDKPGEIVEWNAAAGPRPEPVAPPAFDGSSVGFLFESAQKDFQDVVANHDILAQGMPSEIRSAPALRILKETDSALLRPKVSWLERCTSQLGQALLITAAQILGDEQLVEILGSGKEMRVAHFRASQLRGVKSVRVIPGSMVPESSSLKLQTALDLTQVGGLNPGGSDADREVLVRAAAFNEFDPETLALNQERERAQRENERMFAPLDSGMFGIPPVMPFDNDAVHLRAHNERIRSPEFDRLPEAQKQAILGHNFQHEERLRQAEQARLAAQVAIKGTPGPKGQPSPPKPSRGQ